MNHRGSELGHDYYSEVVEDRQPEVTPEKDSRVLTRLRRIPVRACAIASSTSSASGFSFHVSPPPAPQQSLPYLSNPESSSQL